MDGEDDGFATGLSQCFLAFIKSYSCSSLRQTAWKNEEETTEI
jgi:hypothetical protein